MTREEKIEFLKTGQREIGQYVNYNKFGDFTIVSDKEKELDELIEELDWMWKQILLLKMIWFNDLFSVLAH